MLITFYTDAYENITMQGQYAKCLLEWMGQSGTVPGALLDKDIPQALANLEKNLTQHDDINLSSSKDHEKEEESHVPLANRAFPLIQLLKAAASKGCHVMWK